MLNFTPHISQSSQIQIYTAPQGVPQKVVQAALSLPGWNSATSSIQPLSGGLTNVNYLVKTPSISYFVRCSGSYNALLNSFLETEYKCASIASQAGLTPKIIGYIPQEGMLISEFIDTKGIKIDLRNLEMQSKFLEQIRTLHSLKETFPRNVSVLDEVHKYLENGKKVGAQIPIELTQAVFDAEQLLQKFAEPRLSPCHFDLHHENALYDGEKLWLIDWEYAGNGNPLFDLATAASTENFTDAEMNSFLKNYHNGEEPKETEIQYFYLMRIFADLRWALWSYIQDKISTIDTSFTTFAKTFLKQGLERLQQFKASCSIS